MTVTRRFYIRSPLSEINYYLLILIFLFIQSGTKTKSPVLSSATQNAMPQKNQREVGNGRVLM